MAEMSTKDKLYEGLGKFGSSVIKDANAGEKSPKMAVKATEAVGKGIDAVGSAADKAGKWMKDKAVKAAEAVSVDPEKLKENIRQRVAPKENK